MSDQKPFWQSSTIRNISYSVGASIASFAISNSEIIAQAAVALAPESFKPAAEAILRWGFILLANYFGIKAVKGRAQVGDIKSLYRKS